MPWDHLLCAAASEIELNQELRKQRIRERKQAKLKTQEEESVPPKKSAASKSAPLVKPLVVTAAVDSKKNAGKQLQPDQVKEIIKQRREKAMAKKSVPGIKQSLTTKRKTGPPAQVRHSVN